MKSELNKDCNPLNENCVFKNKLLIQKCQPNILTLKLF